MLTIAEIWFDISKTAIIGASYAILLYSFFTAAFNWDISRPENDRRIIGDTFSGLKKSARLFSRSYKELMSGNFATALDGFNEVKAMKLSPKEKAVLFFFLGKTYELMGYPTNSANFFKDSIDQGISFDEVYIKCGRMMVACGNFSGAEDVYNELLSRETYLDTVYTDLGMAFLKADEPDRALEAFSSALKRNLNYAFALGGMAVAYLLKKDAENANFFYAKAVLNNIEELDGFTDYYIGIAESQGILESLTIKPKPKVYIDPQSLITQAMQN
ncbi:MAG: hypothetical protein LBM87_04070 [Ruminococcus sp.]|nr:hypothetical protein [Ruminococcus sp.]